jgi:hypothetical protein
MANQREIVRKVGRWLAKQRDGRLSREGSGKAQRDCWLSRERRG